MNLGLYLDKVYYLLRDHQRTEYPLNEVIDAINQARADLVVDTGCLRALSTGVFTVANQVKYTNAAVLSDLQRLGVGAVSVPSILGIAIYWSARHKPTLDYLPFEDFNAYYLSFTGSTFIPSVWSFYEPTSFYIAPFPNSAYQMEIDCTYLPPPLANTGDTDLIPAPFSDNTLIPYLACSVLKHNLEAYSQAASYEAKYQKELERRMSMFPSFRVPSRYGSRP
jgi:hypothetical protein